MPSSKAAGAPAPAPVGANTRPATDAASLEDETNVHKEPGDDDETESDIFDAAVDVDVGGDGGKGETTAAGMRTAKEASAQNPTSVTTERAVEESGVNCALGPGNEGRKSARGTGGRRVVANPPVGNVSVASWPPASSARSAVPSSVAFWPPASSVKPAVPSSPQSPLFLEKFYNLPNFDRIEDPPIDPAFDLNSHDPQWVSMYDKFVMLRLRAVMRGILSEEWLTEARFEQMRSWVANQRLMYWRRAQFISAYGPNSTQVQLLLAKTAKLRSLNFVWFPKQEPPDSETDEWSEYFLDLRDFVVSRGHSSVPNTSELGLWAALQRKKFKNKTLNQDRVEALDRIGFVWEDPQSDFYFMLSKLKDFKNIYGDCLVPCPESVEPVPGESLDEYKEYEDTWWWMQKVRVEREQADPQLDENQMNTLIAIGFIWKKGVSQNWIWYFRQLKRLKQETGSLKEYADSDQTLRNWVNHQREYYQKLQRNEKGLRQIRSNLSEETIQLLNDISFDWSRPSPPLGFDKRFELLVEFKEKHGHLFIPQTDKINGNFVKHLRREYCNFQNGKKADITEERIRKLESIGFVWRVRNKRGLGRQKNTPLDHTQKEYREARKRRKAMEAAEDPNDNKESETKDESENVPM